MSDTQQIANVIARYFAAVDAKDFTTAAALMTNPFHLDYSSYGAGEAADLDPADIVKGWAEHMAAFDHLQHLIGGLDIETAGQTATAKMSLIAHHVTDGQQQTILGSYDKTLVKGEHGWRISGSTFHFKCAL